MELLALKRLPPEVEGLIYQFVGSATGVLMKAYLESPHVIKLLKRGEIEYSSHLIPREWCFGRKVKQCVSDLAWWSKNWCIHELNVMSRSVFSDEVKKLKLLRWYRIDLYEEDSFDKDWD
jgi:hypothetical protein